MGMFQVSEKSMLHKFFTVVNLWPFPTSSNACTDTVKQSVVSYTMGMFQVGEKSMPQKLVIAVNLWPFSFQRGRIIGGISKSVCTCK